MDGSGNVTATQLYAPYGGVRYSSGTLPTAKGFTGQRADAASGLDYFNARYYDPLAGQFTSADTVLSGGLNRYSYVRDNPETATDPTGHMRACYHNCDYGDGTVGGSGDGGSSTGVGGVIPIIPPNDDGWVNYHDAIDQHYGDKQYSLPPTVIDQRSWLKLNGANSNQRRADNQEAADAPVLRDYFGLTVIQRNGDGQSDYMIGLATLQPGPSIFGQNVRLDYATAVDLYYPQGQTSLKTITNEVRGKHTQAAMVVVDISQNQTLYGYSKDQLEEYGNQIMNVRRPSQAPFGVIFIRDGAVVADVRYVVPGQGNWGPDTHVSPYSANPVA